MEWSNDTVLRFINLYREERALWDSKCQEYKDRHLIHDAWRRIEAALGGKYPIAELKKKKENIMNTFRKIHAKVKASKSMGFEDPYKPDWFAYESMAKFLSEKYEGRSHRNSEVYFSGENFKDDMDLVPEEIDPLSIQEAAEQSMAFPAGLSGESAAEPSVILGHSRKRKLIETTEDGADVLYKLSEELSKQKDECSIFGELLALKLRKLNPALREYAMVEIHHLLYRLKYETPPPSGNPPHPRPPHLLGQSQVYPFEPNQPSQSQQPGVATQGNKQPSSSNTPLMSSSPESTSSPETWSKEQQQQRQQLQQNEWSSYVPH